MSIKRISPKRYIYENGNLVINDMKDESNQIALKKKIHEAFYEVEPKKIINLFYKIIKITTY